MRKIRIAQIGMNKNSHGIQVFDALRRRGDVFDIAGYTLVENEREECAKRLHIFDGYRELTLDEILNDPTIEAVTVETDEVDLLKYTQMAVDHGKHIHMEKPGSPSLCDFEKLVESARSRERVLHLGYMYRYNPLISAAIRDAKNGRFGDVYSVEAQMNCRLGADVREWLNSFPGGMMFYLGCHLIDLVLQIQGRPDNIIPLNKNTLTDGVNAPDYGMAVFEYPNGNSFVKTAAAEYGGYKRRQLVISGSEGMVEIRPLEIADTPDPIMIYTEQRAYDKRDTWHTEGTFTASEPFSRYENMMVTFAAMVRGEAENPYTYDYELELFRTIMKCCGE